MFAQYLDELFVTYISILVLNKQTDQAQLAITNALQICSHFNLHMCQGKLLLIEISLAIEKNNPKYEFLKKLNESNSAFLACNNQLGLAETMFLKAIYHIS